MYLICLMGLYTSSTRFLLLQSKLLQTYWLSTVPIGYLLVG